MMHHQGMTNLTYQDYTPITRLAVIYGGLQVAKSSPFNNAQEIIDYAKANPGKLKASGSGLNSIWHLNNIGMLRAAGLPDNAIRFIPSQGASAALQELASGGVDIVTSSLGEADSMVKAGLVKHMAIMSNEKSAFYPDVPLFKEATGYDWDLQAWNMLVAPKGLDKEAQDKLTAAMKKVYASGELAEFANKQGFEVIELYGDDATQFMANEDKKFGEIIKK